MSRSEVRERVAVVVIGDIGRSPRMQYHALSLADDGQYDVDLIGYDGILSLCFDQFLVCADR
jgi:beta-1,4-mannosyltransferase